MNIKRLIFRTVGVFLLLYTILCGMVFFLQEVIIFHPQVLPKSHVFDSTLDFEELNVQVEKGVELNALLFKSPTPSKGLIFYLHGNSGSLEGWGRSTEYYTQFGYDVCFMDYRGFGKSDGSIHNEEHFYSDIQIVYDQMKNQYDEKNIVILGYSIGTGVAAKIAKDNSPKQLILQAPYVSLLDMMYKKMPYVPSFILKYKFKTDGFLKDLDVPITIFHGDRDKVIPYQSSLDLKQYLKPSDTLITLKNQGHNGFVGNRVYLEGIRELLK